MSGRTVLRSALAFAWYQAGAGSVVRTLGNNHLTDNASAVGSLTPALLQ